MRALFIESMESGYDSGAGVDEVDTALDSAVTAERGLWIRDEPRLRKLLRLFGETDVVLVMVNSEDCRGSGWALDDALARNGRRPVAVFSSGCNRADTAAHELGHSVAALGDEYEDEATAKVFSMWSPNAPNLSLASDPQLAGWKHFLELPGADRFSWRHEGGYYQSENVFRPWPRCRMRLSDDPFCPVCCEAVARAIFETCGLVWDDAQYHRARPLDLWVW